MAKLNLRPFSGPSVSSQTQPESQPVTPPSSASPEPVRSNPLLDSIKRSRLVAEASRAGHAVPAEQSAGTASESSVADFYAGWQITEPEVNGDEDDSYATLDDVEFERAAPHGLEGEIIPPSRELTTGDEYEYPELSTEVDSDHLRRAALKAAEMFNIMQGVKITLDPSQVHAVHTLVRSQYGCLIGAAGTGKTTTTRALLHVLMNGDVQAGIEPLRLSQVNLTEYHRGQDEADEDDMERAAHTRIPSIILCAFTGQATQVLRKNMPPAWKGNVMTIHSMLGFAPEEYIKSDGTKSMRFVPTYTADLRMPWDVIVIDEASMVSLDLWHMILAACKPGCRIYMVGDLNQLPPPIGMGVLGFALARWPVCELTVVHRQSDEAANRIIDTAWAVIHGDYKGITFDDPKEDPNWRVIGMELSPQAHVAHQQVVAIAKNLAEKRVNAAVDPNQPLIYDPLRDRIMTPGNGFNEEEVGYQLGQSPINDSLSRIFGKDSPRIIVDAQRAIKKFSVGYRVMATKNESPGTPNRVTNGLTGKITAIYDNPQWLGDRGLVGDEEDVRRERHTRVLHTLEPEQARSARVDELGESDDFELSVEELMSSSEAVANEKISGPASHVVEVMFDNGAFRSYSRNAEVEQLQLAYASTTHKTQGAEMPTAIIIVHHANKFHLCRENLYTAITRAKERVILLYTPHGLRISLAKQKVSGKNMAEKVANYLAMSGGEHGTGFRTVKVKLSEDD